METFSLVKKSVVNGITFLKPLSVCSSEGFVKDSYCYDIAINTADIIVVYNLPNDTDKAANKRNLERAKSGQTLLMKQTKELYPFV